MVGSSEAAQEVYDMVRRVANLSAFVLITGESGVGKELVARAIHNLGKRARQPFVAVSCGAIPESLIEAELFGHERGAFTGSDGARAGYFEQAGAGTLFLDEIGELSLHTQVKLLRVLQEREFSRLGSNKTIPLQARVLFATHRNLQEMVEAGSFRRDLYFRLNVVKINVPALRERPDDVAALAEHLLQRYTSEYGKPIRGIERDALRRLEAYHWPGNVRELENALQRAVILSDGEWIGLKELPAAILESTAPMESLEIEDPPEPDSFEGLLNRFRTALARNAVTECKGNKTLAAQKLGVSRAYLYRLIRNDPASVSA